MRILVVCKRFYTNKDLLADKFGRLYHLPRFWSERNEVMVLALNYHQAPSINIGHQNLSFSSVDCLPFPMGLIGAYFHCKRKSESFNPNVVISSGDIITAHIGYRIARKVKARWFYDVYDDYRYFGLSRMTQMSRLFPYFCRNANGILAASKSLRDICLTWNKNIHVTQNGYDPTVFYPDDKAQARQRLGLNLHLKLIVFTGSIDNRFDAQLVKYVINRLHNQDPAIRLVHAGKINSKSWQEEPWLISLGELDQLKVVEVIRSADVCIAPYRRTALSESCNPCKLAEYLACRKPIVASDITPLLELESLGVKLYEAGGAKSFEDGLVQQLSTPSFSTPNTSWSWSDLAASAQHFIQQSEETAD
ncbi:MAG: glycosyltransferase [Marinobacter sp.]